MSDDYPITRQVCTLEQAKKLSELLGEDAPESLWVWAKVDTYGTWKPVLEENYISNPLIHWNSDSYNAYTGDEFGALLPHEIIRDGEKEHYWQDRSPESVNSFDNGYDFQIIDGETEAQARAALLIFILEKEWIKAEDVKYERA